MAGAQPVVRPDWCGGQPGSRQRRRRSATCGLRPAYRCSPAQEPGARTRALHGRGRDSHQARAAGRLPAALAARHLRPAARARPAGRVLAGAGVRGLAASRAGPHRLPMHRGVLAAMQRRPLPGVAEVLAGARRIVVLEDIVDHTNVGAIFRCVAGLGFDAVSPVAAVRRPALPPRGPGIHGRCAHGPLCAAGRLAHRAGRPAGRRVPAARAGDRRGLGADQRGACPRAAWRCCSGPRGMACRPAGATTPISAYGYR